MKERTDVRREVVFLSLSLSAQLANQSAGLHDLQKSRRVPRASHLPLSFVFTIRHVSFLHENFVACPKCSCKRQCCADHSIIEGPGGPNDVIPRSLGKRAELPHQMSPHLQLHHQPPTSTFPHP